MPYKSQVNFASELLARLCIPNISFELKNDMLPENVDLGLRHILYSESDYSKFMLNSLSQAESNTIYCFSDEYFCKYIFLRIPDPSADRYFFIGPYLLSVPTKEDISKRTSSFGLSENLLELLVKYYNSLPLVEDEKLLLAIGSTLGRALWDSDDNFKTEYISYIIPDSTPPVSVNTNYQKRGDSLPELKALEDLYASEKLLMDAVSQGQLHKLSVMGSSLFSKGIESRLPDTLRNRKNYLIILKTILRKAAEYGGVHPLHIDRLSSEYAAEIENINSISAYIHLQSKMIQDYCLLVKNHSLKKYSYLVGKAITIINYDLTADLSLKSISAQLNVNSSYLSGIFHKECGCTLTEYVKHRRIEQAVFFLSETGKSVQNIAYECGISDANYFVKLFKAETGLTPTQYRSKYSNK